MIYWQLRREKLCPGEAICSDSGEGHAADCDLIRLEDEMRGPHGQLIRQAADLSFDLEAGFFVDRGEVAADVYRAFRILREERAKWQSSKSE